MKKYKCILFDLDGTLTDPFDGITKSVQRGLLHFGIVENNREKLGAFIGPPLRESFALFYNIPKERVEEAVAAYREYFSTVGMFENEVYDGIVQILAGLKERGVKILLATSKPEVYARKITEHFGLDQYFFEQCGADLEGKYETKSQVIARAIEVCGEAAENILMVGDRRHDVIGAKENGIECIGVLWGYGDREELVSAGAAEIFETPESFKAALFSAFDE